MYLSLYETIAYRTAARLKIPDTRLAHSVPVSSPKTKAVEGNLRIGSRAVVVTRKQSSIAHVGSTSRISPAASPKTHSNRRLKSFMKNNFKRWSSDPFAAR